MTPIPWEKSARWRHARQPCRSTARSFARNISRWWLKSAVLAALLASLPAPSAGAGENPRPDNFGAFQLDSGPGQHPGWRRPRHLSWPRGLGAGSGGHQVGRKLETEFRPMAGPTRYGPNPGSTACSPPPCASSPGRRPTKGVGRGFPLLQPAGPRSRRSRPPSPAR